MATRRPDDHRSPLEPDLESRWAGEILETTEPAPGKPDRWGWVRHLAPVLPRIRYLTVLGAEFAIAAVTWARIDSPTGITAWEFVATVAALLALGALGYRAPPGDLTHARPQGRPHPHVPRPAEAHARPGG